MGLLHTHQGYEQIGLFNCETPDVCQLERMIRPEDCDGECPDFSCGDTDCGPNCKVAGDLVCDTPPDRLYCGSVISGPGDFLDFPGWVDDCGEEYRSNTIVIPNVMSYWPSTSPKNITVGQACRAYNMILATHQKAISESSSPTVIDEDYVVTSNTTLTSDHIFNGNIVVNDGAILTFNGMRAEISGQIKTEGLGESIKISNSKLLPICSQNLWGGIVLKEGTEFEVNNSTIEDANLIWAQANSNPSNQTPSSFLFDQATMDNSPIWIDHHGGHLNIINSVFQRSQPTVYPTFYIDGENMDDVFVIGSTFTNSVNPLTDQSLRSDGLYMIDVGFNIKDCTFDSFKRGITASTILDAPNGGRIDGCNFTNNYIGVDATIFTGLKLTNNEIKVNLKGSDDGPIGVSLKSCIDYTIINNTFSGNNFPSEKSKAIGLIIKNGGPDFEQVIDNDFELLSEAIIALGNNRDVGTDGATGLEFICNNMGFTSISTSDFRIEDDGIQRLQGTPAVGAGNNFSFGGRDSDSAIRMNTESDMTYYRLINGIQNDPALVDPVKVLVLNSLQNPPCFEIGFRQNSVSEKNVNLIDLITNYNNLKGDVLNIVRAGRKTPISLLNDIRLKNLAIRAIATDKSNSLSTEELNAYWNLYKSSKVAQRKASIDGLNSNNNELLSKIDFVKNIADDLYAIDDKNTLRALIIDMMESGDEIDREIYRNLLINLNLQSFAKKNSIYSTND